MSRYYDVLSAVKTQLDALSAFDGYTFQIRKKPAYYKDSESLPLAIISPRLEKISAVQMGNTFISFPVILTLVQSSDLFMQDATSLQAQLAAREAAFDNLFKGSPLSALAAVRDCESYDPSPAFDLSGLDTSLDISLQEFTFLYTAARS